MQILPSVEVKDKVIKEVIGSIKKLDGWISRNGWAGYDPYDIQGHPLFTKLLSHQNLITRKARGALYVIVNKFPHASRRILNTKSIIAKAMGLFASAYLELYQYSKEDSYLQKANECLNWLEENRSQDYAGACWGLPFDWQSVIFIPKYTPAASITTICGNACWDFYKFTNNKKYLDLCESICNFLIGSLNIDRIDRENICFSYTPIDRFHVHNANLFAAAFLIKVGTELGREDFYQYGNKALNYTLDAQNKNGSFYYWALSEKEVYNIPEVTLKNIDHYHTGFVLRSLYSIYKSTDDKRVFEALSNGYQFYRDNLFDDKTVPKSRPDSKYPINIHGCAEAIFCMSTLSDIFPDALEYAQNAFLWTRGNMQDKDGHFYYLRTERRVNRTPYIRWGQAWMMRALANLLSSLV